MIGNSKGKYVKIELSEFELQMLWVILDSSKVEEDYWYTQQNLEDLQSIITDVINPQ